MSRASTSRLDGSSRSSGRAVARARPWLAGVLNGPRLPDHRDLDLSRILELVFDAPRDVLGQPHRFLVRHAVALDDDADLAAGLEGERFRDALEGVGDAL